MASRVYLKPPEASDVAGPLEADGLQPLLQAGFDGAQPAAAPADDGHLLCHAAPHHRVSAWRQRRTAGLSSQGCNCAGLWPWCTKEVPSKRGSPSKVCPGLQSHCCPPPGLDLTSAGFCTTVRLPLNGLRSAREPQNLPAHAKSRRYRCLGVLCPAVGADGSLPGA